MTMFGRLLVTCYCSIFLFINSPKADGKLCFVHAEPGTWYRGGQSWPVKIYFLNEQSHNLECFWQEIDTLRFVDWVQVYSKFDIIALSAHKDLKRYVTIIDSKSGSIIDDLQIGNYGSSQSILGKYLIVDKRGNLVIGATFYENDTSRTTTKKYFEISKKVNPETKLKFESEVRLAGSTTTYGSTSSDIVTLHVAGSGSIIYQTFDSTIRISKLPPDLLVSDTTTFWNLTYMDENYRLFARIPDTNSFIADKSAYLIQDRNSDNWSRVVVDGSATELRFTNGWLAGVITSMNPITSFSEHYTHTPIWTDMVVIVKLPEIEYFAVSLGKGCEVLWLEPPIVYYRVDRKLFKAKIENDDFVDRIELLEDPSVKFLHWAYKLND
ncbi:MAG TPA: hypothetical protein VHP63_04545 [candidate division Zixibacteria bacterium]|nr:hypothetical protein [candidate division Zixibacteria bacterium]